EAKAQGKKEKRRSGAEENPRSRRADQEVDSDSQSPDAGIVAATPSTVVVVAAADAADGSRAAECRRDSTNRAMRCLLCRQLMQEPHILICCGATACKRCLHAALFEAGSPSLHRCRPRKPVDRRRLHSAVVSDESEKANADAPPPSVDGRSSRRRSATWQAANAGISQRPTTPCSITSRPSWRTLAAYQQLGYYCQPGLAYPLPHQGAPIYSAGPTARQPLTEAEFRSGSWRTKIPSADGRDGQAAAVDRGGRSRSSRRQFGTVVTMETAAVGSAGPGPGPIVVQTALRKRRGRSDKADAGRSRSRSRSRHRGGRRCPRSPRSPRSPRDRRRDDSSPIPKRRRVTVSPSPVAYRTFSRMIDQYCSSGTSSGGSYCGLRYLPCPHDGSVKFDKAKLEEMACSAASAAALPDRTESDREEGECESETDGGDSSIGDDIFVVEKCDYNDARVNSVDDGNLIRTCLDLAAKCKRPSPPIPLTLATRAAGAALSHRSIRWCWCPQRVSPQKVHKASRCSSWPLRPSPRLLEFYCDTVGPSGGVTFVDPEPKTDAERLAPRLASRRNARFARRGPGVGAAQEAAFDLAVMANVYHHLRRHRHRLAAVARLLRPGGPPDASRDLLRPAASRRQPAHRRSASALWPPRASRCAFGRLRVARPAFARRSGDFYVDAYVKQHRCHELASLGRITKEEVAELLGQGLPTLQQGDPNPSCSLNINLLVAAEA
uniref:RING-type domain-containing protein n=1 Tax=Macrostomum lignano TaxID=282301 RepID=A0A1I8F8K7_9PLAT